MLTAPRFKNHTVNSVETEVVDVPLAHGTIATFAADDISDDGMKYSEKYAGAYQAFKEGAQEPETDADRIDRLEADLADRNARIADLEAAKPIDTDKQIEPFEPPPNPVTHEEAIVT